MAAGNRQKHLFNMRRNIAMVSRISAYLLLCLLQGCLAAYIPPISLSETRSIGNLMTLAGRQSGGSDSDDDSGGLSIAGKIGVGVGVPAAIAVLVGVGLMIKRCRDKRRDREEGNGMDHLYTTSNAPQPSQPANEYKGYYFK
ncbi:unnamed protein product [Clonostachys solani]|uniref:Uncharacterized protein n=1 Tax=Clonostachys solani TaxID=160281 RepID=A0A9P0EG59_9HYPO|nr:unnamed protein product [Clonostachys solani]